MLLDAEYHGCWIHWYTTLRLYQVAAASYCSKKLRTNTYKVFISAESLEADRLRLREAFRLAKDGQRVLGEVF